MWGVIKEIGLGIVLVVGVPYLFFAVIAAACTALGPRNPHI
jgi:hypothetical protein